MQANQFQLVTFMCTYVYIYVCQKITKKCLKKSTTLAVLCESITHDGDEIANIWGLPTKLMLIINFPVAAAHLNATL